MLTPVPGDDHAGAAGNADAAGAAAGNGSSSEAAKLAAIVQHSSDAIIAKDLSGIITSWNPGAERMYGYSAEEAIGRSVSILIPPERISELADISARVAASEHIESLQSERVRKDGSRLVVSLSISPVRDESGAIVGAATIARDITEAVCREAELAEARAAIEQAADRQQRLMGEVLWSVTGGRLRLCFSENELPEPLSFAACFDEIAPASLREFRHQLEAIAVERGFPDERWEDLVTAAGEAAMNAVVHAGGGKCRIHCCDDAIQVWVEDSGRGIDMAHIHRATLEDGYTTGLSLGHGFSMMLRTADRVWLLTSPEGTRVVIWQARHKPEPTWLLGHEVLGGSHSAFDSIPAL